METILKNIRKTYINEQIWLTEIPVIDRLLERKAEMKSFYEELVNSLSEKQQKNLWDALLCVSAHYTPEASKELRIKKKEINKINADISKIAIKLAVLLEERKDICETSSISGYDDYHPLHLLDRAAENNKNHLYNSYLRDRLESLHGQFDLKYWPENYQIVEAIADFAKNTKINVTDNLTKELLASRKQSNSDYLRAILAIIDERQSSGGDFEYHLPYDFRISDKGLATFINCTLDLSAEEVMSAENIKRARQNIRESKKRV